MLNLSSPRCLFFYTLQLLFVLQAKVLCFQHKVGDLNSWTVPTAANQGVYDKWSKNNIFRVKDSLCKFLIYSSLFLLFFLFLNTDLSMQYTIIPSMSLYSNKLFQTHHDKMSFRFGINHLCRLRRDLLPSSVTRLDGLVIVEIREDGFTKLFVSFL